MKSKSLVFKSAVLAVFFCGIAFGVELLAAEKKVDVDSMTISEVMHLMTRTHPKNDLHAKVIIKAGKDPAFRKQLIDMLTYRLNEGGRIKYVVRALKELNAREVLPQIKKLWNETEKKTPYLEFGNLRIHLLHAMAEFLPEKESIQFLIDTESDKTEPPMVRRRATILLCQTGNEKAIEHVLSVYEQAKKEFPVTTRLSLKHQKGYIEGAKKRDKEIYKEDTDRDMLSSYLEKGLLLDPDNMDTDGDGIIDGNDRNPLCKRPPKSDMTVDQEIAHFMFYLHTRYDTLSRCPFNFKLYMVRPIDTADNKGNKSLFDGMQFSGVDGLVLHVSREQVAKFREIHGSGTSVIGIHKLPESKESKDIKKFYLSISGGPELHRMYEITFKRFDNVWLPVSWELGLIT